MAEEDVLLEVMEKFISPYINLSPHDARPGWRKLPA